MDVSIGIRADGEDSGYTRSRIILKENNYRVWSTVVEQTLREKKLWLHVMGVRNVTTYLCTTKDNGFSRPKLPLRLSDKWRVLFS